MKYLLSINKLEKHLHKYTNEVTFKFKQYDYKLYPFILLFYAIILI